MALITYFRHEDGVRRLLDQPRDVAVRPPGSTLARFDRSDPPYQRLYGYYAGDLRTALSIAEPWWEATVAAREGLGMSRDEAVAAAFTDRAAGAASHPKVVWIVRTYWLKCDALNRMPEYGPGVEPETLLLRWLIDAGEEELVRLVACMPYWPVGLDADGNWC